MVKSKRQRLRVLAELSRDPASAKIGAKHVVCVDGLGCVSWICRGRLRHLVVERHVSDPMIVWLVSRLICPIRVHRVIQGSVSTHCSFFDKLIELIKTR